MVLRNDATNEANEFVCIGNPIIFHINKLDSISDTYGFKIIASVSIDEADLPESLKSKVIVVL